jgi:hypothetical protein
LIPLASPIEWIELSHTRSPLHSVAADVIVIASSIVGVQIFISVF